MKKEKNDIEKLSKYTLRQLDVLSKYYEIDYDERLVVVTFVSESINEYLDLSLSTPERPYFSKSLLLKISDVSHSIPKDFDMKINFKVNDYQGYDPNLIMESIADAFEIFSYDVRVETNFIAKRTSFIFIFGFTCFAWLFFLCSFKFFGDSESQNHQLVHELVFAVGSALIWQSVYFIFLPKSDHQSIYYSILGRVRFINLYDKKNKLLISCNQDDYKKNWLHETPKLIFARKLLVFTGTGLLCLASYNLTEVISIGLIVKAEEPMSIVSLLISIAAVIFLVIAGIGSISFYLGKGPFRKVVPFFGAVSIILSILNTISYIFDAFVPGAKFNVVGLIINALLIALSIALFVSSIILTKYTYDRKHLFKKET